MSTHFKNYTGTIQTHKDVNYQLLLASQLYGTHFSIYGHFKRSTINKNETGDKCDIIGISLKIINYKGNYQLGFSLNEKPTLTKEGNLLQLPITLQAVSSGNTEYETEVDCKNKIFCVNGDGLEVVRNLLPIGGFNSDSPIYNGVFDSEFYFRDGLRYAKKVVREIDNEDQIQVTIGCEDQIQVKKIKEGNASSDGPGKLCRKGHFNMIVN